MRDCVGHSYCVHPHDLPEDSDAAAVGGALSSVRLPTAEDAEAVNSREELVSYIQRISAAIAGGKEVENATLDRFLEALSRWIEDCPGFFRNTGYELPGDASSWPFVAHALSAALIYE
jgi:hypothetical protein